MTSERSAALAGPDVRATGVTFRVADPDDRFAGVRLVQDVRVPGDRLEFARAGSGWELELARTRVWRMEYRLQLRHRGGARSWTERSGGRLG
jgi:hypothetical protein